MVAKANVMMDKNLSLGQAINMAKKVYVRIAGTSIATLVTKKVAWNIGRRYGGADTAEWSWTQCDMGANADRAILIFSPYDTYWHGKAIRANWRDGNKHFNIQLDE